MLAVFVKLLIPFPWASKIAILPSLPLQTCKDHTKELWDPYCMWYVQGTAQSPNESLYDHWTQHQRHKNAYLTKFSECENTVKHDEHKSETNNHLEYQAT